MKGKNFFDDLVETIQRDGSLDEAAKSAVYRNFTKLKNTKVNLLVTGATGCGKSSTINALFNTEHAKVGQGVDPETMEIIRYELDNIVLFDSPGLGDGKEADIRHSKGIIEKLYEKDEYGAPLIDLVLVILDGSSRDLGTSFELINSVIIPNLGDDHSRLLVAINQADMAMKGRYWNQETNQPEPALVSFLEEKVTSTKRRIKEAADVNVNPIYYSAGYKDAGQAQKPYNLSKLLLQILRHTKVEKRAVFAQDVNTDEQMWKDDDQLENYQKEIQLTVIESIKINASAGSDKGGEIGSAIGSLFGKKGQILGEIGGKVVGAVAGGLVGLFRSLF